MSDLADRPNPSRWAELLDQALPIIDEAFASGKIATDPSGAPAWTLGGGTAIALRLGHRASDDVDLFVGAADLRLFIPARNARAAALEASMQFPGNYLKFALQAGEIDFLPGSLLTEPGFTPENFRGRPVGLQTAEEVIVKKVRYRATSFKPRDIFDLAAVSARSSALAGMMIEEVCDRLPTLLTAIRRHGQRSFEMPKVRPMPGYEGLLGTALAEAESFVSGLIGEPGRPRGSASA